MTSRRLHLHPASVVAVCLVAALALSARSASAAAIVFDTFGPGDTFDPGPFGVDGSGVFQAFLFSPTATGTLEQITVALGRTDALQATTTFNLYQDAGGGSLGALIESFSVTNSVAPDNTSPFTGATVTFGSLLAPVLTSGATYWLSFTEPEAANGATSLWFINSIGASGTRLTSALPAAPNVMPAFRVEVTAVPEPATSALVLVGALVAFRARRARRA